MASRKRTQEAPAIPYMTQQELDAYWRSNSSPLQQQELQPHELCTFAIPVDFPTHFDPLGAGRAAGASAGARHAAATARATGAGSVPPTNNMGGKSTDAGAATDELMVGDRQTLMLITDDGEVKELVLRNGWGNDLAHVDFISFTVHEDTCHAAHRARCVSDDEFIASMSSICESLFGFGVTSKREKGFNFYQATWILGDNYGLLSFGGQRNTLLVQVNGTGCNAALAGWEKRLRDFLIHDAVRPRITRVDCAYDDLDGEYSVDLASDEVRAGLYNCGGRHPRVERRGDWDRPDGSGRTLYLGKRKNGKFLRVYEKGKEQGCSASPWVRVEVEFKSVDRVIPFDVLTNTGSYFAGAYPAFERFRGKKQPARIEIQLREFDHGFDHALHYAQLQVGRLVNYMKTVAQWDDQTIVTKLARPEAGMPRRLALSNLSCELGNREFYHHGEPIQSADPYNMLAYPANLASGSHGPETRGYLRN